VNEYGRQKLAAEQEVSRDARDSLIVRTTAVYGRERRGKNFVTALTSALRAGRSVRVPADQIGNPTYAPNLADVVVELANSGTRGVANVAGPDRISRHRLALEAAAVFGLDPGLIVATSTPELGQRAARPLDAGFVVDRTRALTTLPLVGYREGLRLMAAEERP
jgi:dTDP-4-dehydrorhamnose reductase